MPLGYCSLYSHNVVVMVWLMVHMNPHLPPSLVLPQLQLLRQEKLRLQDEVTEKNKLVRFQQLKIVDMRKALNKELVSLFLTHLLLLFLFHIPPSLLLLSLLSPSSASLPHLLPPSPSLPPSPLSLPPLLTPPFLPPLSLLSLHETISLLSLLSAPYNILSWILYSLLTLVGSAMKRTSFPIYSVPRPHKTW